MKSSILILIMTIFTGTLLSQTIPANVQSAFNKKFPGQSEVDWEKAKGIYLADFSHNDLYKTAKFDESGNWIETRTYIEEDDLPSVVNKNISEKYEDVYYESIMKVENNKNENFFDLIINAGDDMVYIVAKPDGSIVKSEIRTNNQSGGSDEE